MKNLTEKLMALQELQSRTASALPNRAERMDALRTQIPTSILNIFDRLVARQKRPVALVRNGVCSECHIRLAVGVLASMTFDHGTQQCGSCGRFLYLPKDESPVVVTAPTMAKSRSKKEMTAQTA